MAYFNQIWDSGYHYVEPFETDPKNQILVKFSQNDALILGQILKNQIFTQLFDSDLSWAWGQFWASNFSWFRKFTQNLFSISYYL